MIEFILGTVGLTFILTYSYVLKGFREKLEKIHPKLGKLINCTQCAGFYAGLLTKFLLMIYYGVIFTWLSPIIIIIYGFIGSLISFTWYSILKKYTDI